MEQAEKNLSFLNGVDANASIVNTFKDDIKDQKGKLNEVKAFIDSRYQENNDNRKMRPRDPKINAA